MRVVEPEAEGAELLFCYVGFQVLTAVVMKSSVFWAVKTWSLVDIHGRFGRTYCLVLYIRRLSQARSYKQSQFTRRYIKRVLAVFILPVTLFVVKIQAPNQTVVLPIAKCVDHPKETVYLGVRG
jgi:hypothetical protein